MGKPLYRRVVPETFVQLLYEYVEARGHSPEQLLGEAWPEPDPQRLGGVDIERWEHLLELAAARLADPLICLHVASTITARHLGILGSVLLASENLGAALQRLDRYLRLVYDVLPMVLRRGDGWVEITWDESEFSPGFLVNETGTAVLVQFCRSLVRGVINPLRVELRHEAPADIGVYEAFFGCPVHFGGSEHVVRYGVEALAMPLKGHDPALITLLEQHANRLLDQLPEQDEVVVQLRKAIARALGDGEPDIDRISTQLCTSSRTLQRRLRDLGTTFRTELNLVRYELAQSYLRDPRLQLVDVALLLGYSEQSAFTRAFRGWAGCTPLKAKEAYCSGRDEKAAG